ncbi:FAR1-related protein [Striga asiatica]|uniref:FAR1-related protein n=1 Tax=Striga asiatica TaxID=4170 RepID=A0A5A7P0Y4_STRAF|nr:FAR1-related protein [Striga asiatica]
MFGRILLEGSWRKMSILKGSLKSASPLTGYLELYKSRTDSDFGSGSTTIRISPKYSVELQMLFLSIQQPCLTVVELDFVFLMDDDDQVRYFSTDMDDDDQVNRDGDISNGTMVKSSELTGDHSVMEEMLTTENENQEIPEVGMKFANENEVFQYYKRYAYRTGFPIRKRNSTKGDDGIVRYMTYTCSREGRRSYKSSTSLNLLPTSQTGCKARLTACSDACGVWRINVVHLEHNHKTSPSKSRLYKCNRQVSNWIKRQLEVNDIAGIPIHKSYNAAVVEVGGFENMTCVEKDCRNFIDKVRRLRLGEGDAVAISSYFSKMNNVSKLPHKYVLRRWRRDVSSPYVRIASMYDGMASTVEQLRYEKLCAAFTKMANLVAENEERSNQLLE